VTQFAWLVSHVIRDKGEKKSEILTAYHFDYKPKAFRAPELAVVQAEKEIRDMALLTTDMYEKFSGALTGIKEGTLSLEGINDLIEDLKMRENRADEMREQLTSFLIECTRSHLAHETERNITQLLRIIGDLEDMTDDCYSLTLLLERSIRKDQIFKHKEMEGLMPYVGLVGEFLHLLSERLGGVLDEESADKASDLEGQIDKSRNHLRKLGRKRIEAGENVKTELLFIDLVRRIERLGDYCYAIANALGKMRQTA
jgi:phosphate:Na+ symporter